MIHVAFAIPELGHGGPDVVFRTLLRHIDRDRFRTSVVIRDGGATGDVDGSLVAEVAPNRYPLLSTRRALQRIDPDIVLSTQRMNPTCAAARPLSDGPAQVVRMADPPPRKLRDHIVDRSRVRHLASDGAFTLAVHRADGVVAQTEGMLHDLTDRYGEAVGAKTSVIHNPVDVDRVLASAADAGAAFDHDGPLIVSVGRLTPQKGYDLLLSALRDVVDAHTDAHLVLIGQGPDRRALLDRARRLGVAGNVTFLGQVGNPFPVVSRADVFVSSSRYEGFSNTLAEAQALGVPAVAVGGSGAGDVIVTDATGIVLPQPEPTALAAAITSVLDDPGRFDREVISESIRERFNAARITAEYEAMLIATLEGASSPAAATVGPAPATGARSTVAGLGSDHGGVPGFVCVGAMKAGTTSLWEYLRRHPDVSLPRSKEIDYFIDERIVSRDDYARRFRECDPTRILGDVSPRYSLAESRRVAQAMASVIPDAKLVYLLREPAERMRSHYRHEVLRSRETRDATEAIDDDLYLAPSRYGAHLEAYLEHFPAEQVLLVHSDALRADPEGSLATVFAFIGADPTVGIGGPTEVYAAESRTAQSPMAERVRTSRLGRMALGRVSTDVKDRLSDTYRRIQNPATDRRARALMATSADWRPNAATREALVADGHALAALLPRVAGFVGGDAEEIARWPEVWDLEPTTADVEPDELAS